jgi:excisionase family DNA binding protein
MKGTNMIEPIALSILQASAFISCSRSKIYQLIAQKEIRTIKVGSKTLVLVSSLRDFIASHERVVA